MSYILEALRRAERERAQGQIPGGEVTGASGSAPPSRGPVLKVVIGLLAINAIVLTVLLVRHQPEPEGIVAQPRAAVAAPAPQPAPSPAPASAPAPIDRAPVAGDEAVVEDGVSSMDDLGAAGESDEPAAAQAAPAPPRGSVTFAKKPLTPAVAAPPPETETETEETAPEEAPVAESAPPTGAPPASSGPKPLSDMSAAYQGAFPQFTLEVHVYDPAPQRRFAIIDGERYHEGDALPQGAKLAQIVPQGLVIDFRNERVLYPIGRH